MSTVCFNLYVRFDSVICSNFSGSHENLLFLPAPSFTLEIFFFTQRELSFDVRDCFHCQLFSSLPSKRVVNSSVMPSPGYLQMWLGKVIPSPTFACQVLGCPGATSPAPRLSRPPITMAITGPQSFIFFLEEFKLFNN
uniref:Uncharacterized protein n=1 Tax=Myotis myotis TaxID=51298 RepID=A0A7J7RCD2_MYOMY|nr:hypothetical protein mMyoMyo1_010823 [Myotis myotis]